MMDNKTIAAISTPSGIGGIAVIRISGKDSVAICDKIFRGKEKLTSAKTHTVHYGHIVDQNGDVIDEVLATVMLAPRTFTREDVVEISTHGGMTAPKKVLSALFWAGAYPAGAGEFTKRAFMNGRIDLSSAEAVIDIINSKTELENKNALYQAKGQLAQKVDDIRQQLCHLSASMQVSIDYPDEDLEDMTCDEILAELESVKAKVIKLLGSKDCGKILKDGIKTAICGRPNVGKSSLLNCLAGEERAIVTEIAGTTRDTIEENVNLDGVMLTLTDTAGIRQTDDRIEKIGVERSLENIDMANLILLVLDATCGLTDEDRELIKKTDGKNRIVVINKIDEQTPFEFEDAIPICAKTGEGVDKLSERIKQMYDLSKIGADEPIITNERHIAVLMRVCESITRAIDALNSGLAQDFAALDILSAIEEIGELDGRTVSEDIVSDIFHRFCVGK